MKRVTVINTSISCVYFIYWLFCVLRVPQTTFRFGDFIELPGLWMGALRAVSEFRKWHQARSTTEKCAQSQVQRKPHANIQSPLPAEPHHMHFTLPATNCDDTCEVLPNRELIRDSVSRAFSGTGHEGSLCLGATRIPEGKQMNSMNSAVYTV